MKNIAHIKNLSELLAKLKTQECPTFINLCSRCGNEHYLIDSAVSKMQETYGEKLGYQKITGQAADLIKEELMITKNPVLLLIKDGEIRAVFAGMIAQYKLEQALENLERQSLIE